MGNGHYRNLTQYRDVIETGGPLIVGYVSGGGGALMMWTKLKLRNYQNKLSFGYEKSYILLELYSKCEVVCTFE